MQIFWKIPIISKLVYRVWRLDAARKINWIAPHIKVGETLLEVGSGPGSVVELLRERGHNVTALDVQNSAFSEALAPIVYDGTRMPFQEGKFDTALILTTLHHAHDPDQVVREAARVAKRVIIIEDIYKSPMQRVLTKIMDSITNMEFFGHPHNNRDHDGWQACFTSLNLKTTHISEKPIAGYFLQALYVLEKNTEVMMLVMDSGEKEIQSRSIARP
ncbi:class I SAM-dependent methyltransferase [Kordiimonas sp. SCSIO 12610]|uniref:class I SAM-dependent methyltransferase n=1 Tax=Kordiimonas sp. SCSIO 12610 TaxID=2829597 RepID=UPI00210BB3A6|nr:class I SAM-dependent methyltransferase [Kordiimonas sp. SCSIO 12610]UTW56210.1 class I SAM-dependent methyltransferase [Kordiimonas sp. SCSIO 12610]